MPEPAKRASTFWRTRIGGWLAASAIKALADSPGGEDGKEQRTAGFEWLGAASAEALSATPAVIARAGQHALAWGEDCLAKRAGGSGPWSPDAESAWKQIQRCQNKVRPDPDGELPVIGEVFRRKVAAALRAYRHQIAEDLGERWLEHLKKADRERPAAPPDILDLETIADSAISKAALSVWEVCFDPDEVGEPPDMGAARQRDRDQSHWLAEDSVGLAATLGGRAVREATDPTEVSALLALVAWLDDPTLPADTGRLFLSQEDVSRVVWVVNQMFPSFGLGRDDRTGDKAVRAARRDLSAARPVSSAEDLLRTLAEGWDESVRWRLHWWSNKVMPLGRLLLYALGGLGPSGCWTDKRVRHEAASALCRQFDNCNAGQEWKILEFASRYIECRGPLTAGVVRSKYEAAIAVELAVEPMDKRSDAALALRVLGFHNDPLGGLHSIESRAAQVMGQEYPHCINRPDCGSHTRPPGEG